MLKKYDIIIAGSGLSAIYSLVELGKFSNANNNCLNIALVGNKKNVLFNPLIYDFVVAEVPSPFLIIDVSSICDNLHVDFYLQTICEVDPISCLIKSSNDMQLAYRVLVLALGNQSQSHSDFDAININALNIHDLYSLRNSFLNGEYLDVCGSGNSALEFCLKYPFIGKLQLKSDKFSAKVIPSLAKRVRRLRRHSTNLKGLRNVHAYNIKRSRGSKHESNYFLSSFINVNKFLQTSYSNIFCIGDQAVFPSMNVQLIGSAQAAYQYRTALSHNVLAILSYKRKFIEFKPVNLGYMYTYGRKKSEVNIFGFVCIRGRIGHVLRVLIYFFRLPTHDIRLSVLKAVFLSPED